jgi:HSP20 family protein
MSGAYTQRRWDPFRDFQREVGRLFETFEPLQPWRAARPFPAVNLYDAKERYILTAELPGMAPEDLDLSITGETLTLRGERRRPEGVADESYRRQERQFGRWSRSVTLPERVDGTKVAAQFAHGILTVTLPKAEEARPRQIVVTTGSRPEEDAR